MLPYLIRPESEIKELFFNMRTPRDVANILEIDYKTLNYILYRKGLEAQYTQFSIAKKTGGKREIFTPSSTLKILQQKLCHILNIVYQPKPATHGFCLERSIVTNASAHKGQKLIINLDLKDFFPSINFGRVRGLLKSKPYSLPDKVATYLAQICCFKNSLPQGAPTSPVVSNMICAKLDNELQRFARVNSCTYTRYADDMSFSFSNTRSRCAVVYEDGKPVLSSELQKIIVDNGFKINEKKTRVANRHQRQEVTGLTVNSKLNVKRKYVRQIRAMLHAWEKYGLQMASEKHFSEFSKKHYSPSKHGIQFSNIVKGKINFLKMVRGQKDEIYAKFINKYNNLMSNGRAPLPENRLDEISKSLWVLENEGQEIQGSAFMLSGFGLVTCNHNLTDKNDKILDDIYVFQYDKPEKKYSVTILNHDKDLDLAILKINDLITSKFGLYSLESENAYTTPLIDEKITTAGFPGYHYGSPPMIVENSCVGVKPYHGVKYAILRDEIFPGNSGGPALNKQNKVIGIVARGREAPVVRNGIILISQLNQLKVGFDIEVTTPLA